MYVCISVFCSLSNVILLSVYIVNFFQSCVFFLCIVALLISLIVLPDYLCIFGLTGVVRF